MGHHARTLTALVAVLTAMLVAAATADAYNSILRVETRAMNSIATGAFVPRQAVTVPDGGVTIKDALTGAESTCPASSPIATLQSALGAQLTTVKDPATGHWLVSSIKNVAAPLNTTTEATPVWWWRVYVDQGPIGANTWNDGDLCAPPPYPGEGSEVLAYQACGTGPGNVSPKPCFPGTPLYLRVRDGGPYDVAPQTVPGRQAAVVVDTIGDKAPANALLATDESSFTPVATVVNGPLVASAAVSFTDAGPHQIIAVEKGTGDRPPGRMAVCVSEGNDGFCGTPRIQAPPEIPYVTPSPCDTNGHDGFCGTVDTSGPVTHVTNLADKKTYTAKKAPGQVKGTIDVDPNGVGAVQLRLTRVTTAKVLVKPKKKTKSKKKRYKTVKRCSAWDDGTALLETTKKCGTKYGKWFKADLSDLRNAFSYSFALKLPRGTYTLEVSATDEDGHKDAPVKGRNVLSFTVK
jgi:hypothetical protein